MALATRLPRPWPVWRGGHVSRDEQLEPAEVERHRHGHLDGDHDEKAERHLGEDDQRRQRAVALLLDLLQVVELVADRVDDVLDWTSASRWRNRRAPR
jgi:hypothetical protein